MPQTVAYGVLTVNLTLTLKSGVALNPVNVVYGIQSIEMPVRMVSAKESACGYRWTNVEEIDPCVWNNFDLNWDRITV